MEVATHVDTNVSSRDLARRLRTGLGEDETGVMPESHAWHVFLELRRRGDPDAGRLFLSALRSLHSRRTLGAAPLSVEDPHIDEHRLVDDPFLADLWKAYKKCIRNHRTGPASQLLRDIEEQLASR